MNYPAIYTSNIDYQSILTSTEIAEISHEFEQFETRQACSIDALKIVQKHRGWISDDVLFAIADFLQMSTAELESVATFYNLIYRRPVGEYVIHICDSISCYLTGYESALAAIKSHLKIDYGETTEDGKFTLLSNACLGNCDKAPAMMIADQHYTHLTEESVIQILNSYQEKGRSNE